MDSFTINDLASCEESFPTESVVSNFRLLLTRSPGELFSTGFTTLRRLSRTRGAGGVVGILVIVSRSDIVEDRIFKRSSLGF